MQFLAITQRTAHNGSSVLVGPLQCLHPPDLFFSLFSFHLRARQQELCAGSKAQHGSVVHNARDATQHHTTMRIITIHILFSVGKVPSLDNLVIITQMLKGRVRVHIRKSAIEHCDAHALAVNSSLLELLALHQGHLFHARIQCAGLRKNRCLRGARFGGNLLHTGHKRQLPHQGNLLLRSGHRHRIEPARLTNIFGGGRIHSILIFLIYRIICNIIQVSMVHLITLNGLGVKIGVRIKCGVVLVGEKHPIHVLRLGEAEESAENDCE